jgi:putative ABC transport system permease protein
MIKPFPFAWRLLKKDWQSKDIRVLTIALILAVTALSSVNLFTSRLQNKILLQASEVLGGDLAVVSYRFPLNELEEYANKLDLKTTQTVSFRSMVMSENDDTLLCEIKSVSNNYPLRGNLEIETGITKSIPENGTVWVEEKLLNDLSLKLGDSLHVGKQLFKIAHLLKYEPDRGNDWMQLAPRVLMNENDLNNSGLLSAGSRVARRLLLVGEQNALTSFQKYVEEKNQADFQLQTFQDTVGQLKTGLTQTEQFLTFAALCTLLLCGAAVAASARYFSAKQIDKVALLRCLGMTMPILRKIYFNYLIILGFLTGLSGVILGFFIQESLVLILGNLFGKNLPPISIFPLIFGFLSAWLMLAGFALPALWGVANIPPLHLLRRQTDSTPNHLLSIFMGLATLILLMFLQSNSFKTTVLMLIGLVGSLLILLLISWLLIKLLNPLRFKSGMWWRFGIANVARYPINSTVQLSSFGLSFMVLLLLTFVQYDLLKTWQTQLPEKTPNYFIANIQPTDVESVKRVFEEKDLKIPFYPMLPAHLTKINDKAVSPEDFSNSRAKRLVGRAFNISWTEQLPIGNELIKGEWWSNQASELSIESGIAELLNIKLGDTLHFTSGGQEISLKVKSLRKLRWDSFQVNFFVITNPDALKEMPVTYIASFYLPPEQSAFLKTLVKNFPSISIINVNSMLERVRNLLEQASQAIQMVFLLSIAAGITVLYALLQLMQLQRRQESAILRTLGASRGQILSGALAEFALIGSLAGFLAASIAGGLEWAVGKWLLEIPLIPSFELWIIGIFGGGLIVSIAALPALFHLLKQSPTALLRTL